MQRTTAPTKPNTRLQRLTELEAIIDQDLEAWIRIGMALREIKETQLFRERCETFEEWAHDRFELGRRQAYHLIAATNVRESLKAFAETNKLPLPANERQARRLAPLAQEQREQAWAAANQIADGEDLSESHVAKAVRELKAKARIKAMAKLAANDAPVEGLGRFPVIYADPPWRYDSGTVDAERKAEKHYPTMEAAQICALPVGKDLATDDAVLFLWCTAPMLREGLQVMDAWGFAYKTNLVWDKRKLGMGYWFRGVHEHLLLGVRGDPPKPVPSELSPSVLHVPRGKHSVKPVEVAELIETYYPEVPKVELFARSARPGWAVWGNEASNGKG